MIKKIIIKEIKINAGLFDREVGFDVDLKI